MNMHVGMGLPSDRPEWYGVVTMCRGNEVLRSLLVVLVWKLKECSAVDFHIRNPVPASMKKSHAVCVSETKDPLEDVACSFHAE